MMVKKTILYLCLISLVSLCFCQTKADKMMNTALRHLNENNESKCIATLEQITKQYPQYAPAYVALGQVYYGKEDYNKACAFYEKGIDLDKDYDLNSYYRLGLINKKLKQYEKARQYLQYYIDRQDKAKYADRVLVCKQELENIDFITYSLKHPVDFTPYNLGTNVNDSCYQYLPSLTMDNKLYFTKRENNREDFYCSEIGQKTDKTLSFGPAVKLPPPLNSDDNEGAASISPDGRCLYFAKCNASDGLGSCDIYVSEKVGNKWSKPKNLGPMVNSSAWDSQPSIASDGRTLFFASNREGGMGKSDLYYSYLRPDGNWTKAKNLGPVINTTQDEISPFIHPSNNYLYFASDGHIGMGGQDIFYSKIEKGRFSKPVNIGYPINTDDDQTCLVVNAEGNTAFYCSSNLEDNYGKTDIYSFELYDRARPTPVAILHGRVKYQDNKSGQSALLEVKDLKSNRIVSSTYSDKATDKYLLALPQGGNYALSVTCEGYLFYSENFSLEQDTTVGQQTRDKDVLLRCIKEGETIVLQNIFFATDSSQLQEESNAELKTMLSLMVNNPKIRIEISGHTDNQGKSEYNLTLSLKRAQNVRQWLIDNGVEPGRITAKGYGMSKPVADNSTPEGRKQNRRTEFKIIR